LTADFLDGAAFFFAGSVTLVALETLTAADFGSAFAAFFAAGGTAFAAVAVAFFVTAALTSLAFLSAADVVFATAFFEGVFFGVSFFAIAWCFLLSKYFHQLVCIPLSVQPGLIESLPRLLPFLPAQMHG
jgi:hypothetical protein